MQQQIHARKLKQHLLAHFMPDPHRCSQARKKSKPEIEDPCTPKASLDAAVQKV